jgi:NADPH:quinone reductase-like Zn-dependent oxidoreductase
MTSVPATYKAYVYEAYGKTEDVIRLRDVQAEPLGPNDVRIRVHSAALNPIDYKLIGGLAAMITGGSPSADQPYRIGFDAAGTVVEVGVNAANEFQVGEAVYTSTPRTSTGSLAEYVTTDAQFVARKPSSLGFDEAAGVPSVALASYQSLTKYGKLQPGERILVIGGSTSCGLFAIQYAKSIGAYVIATTSTKNVKLLESIGADRVIDYTREKWGDVVSPHSVDVVFECSVEPTAWDGDAQLVLKKESGRFVTLRPVQAPSSPKFGATHMSVFGQPSGAQLREITRLIDNGSVKSFVDSTFAFEQVVEAFTHLQTVRVVGKVVLQVQ